MAQGIEYHVRAILSVQKKGGGSQAMASYTSALDAAAGKLGSVGSRLAGDLGGAAKALVAAAATVGAAVAGYTVGKGIQEAVKQNINLENSTFAVASTLQLMNRSGGDFAKNMETSAWAMDELYKRAAKSPATFEQAQELFRNMMPGAAQVTDDMQRILDMSTSALTLGIQMGGDFKQAGADLRRIITGQAGADVRAWVEGLRTPIQEMAKEMYGMTATGDKFVQQFNKMDPVKRFALVEKAVMRLGPATEAAGMMWSGLTSTVEADAQYLLRKMGQATFQGIKAKLIPLVSTGGLLDPTGKTMAKLESAAGFIGSQLAKAADWLVDKLAAGVDYLANNWDDVIIRMSDMWERGVRMAKLLATVAVARKVAGGAAMAVGGGAAAASGLIGIGKSTVGVLDTVGESLGNMRKASMSPGWADIAQAMTVTSMSSIIAAPLLILAGVALAGLAVAFGGVIAFFVDKWDEVLEAIRGGEVTIDPILDAIDLFWVKLTAVGQAFMGGTTPAENLSSGVYGLTEAMYTLMGVMSLGLRVIGWVGQGFDFVKVSLQGVYLGFVGLVQGIVWLVKQAMDVLPDMAKLQMGGGAVDAAYAALDNHTAGVVASMRETVDSFENNKFIAAADAFDRAYVQGEGVTAGIREELSAWKAGEGNGGKPPGAGGEGGGGGNKTPKSQTNINKLIINQDLRGSDPDRVIGAFYKALDKTARQPTSPRTGLTGGI